MLNRCTYPSILLIGVLFAENMSSLVRHMFTPGRMNSTRAVFTNFLSPAAHMPQSITHNNLPSSLLNLPISSSLLYVASIHTSAVVERARQSTRKNALKRCIYYYRMSQKSCPIYIVYSLCEIDQISLIGSLLRELFYRVWNEYEKLVTFWIDLLNIPWHIILVDGRPNCPVLYN